MKIIFVEAKRKLDDFSLNNANFNVLPENIFLAYSIQYKKLAEQIKKKLGKLGKRVIGFRQVLGCAKLKSKYPILLVGSGKFHAIQLALQGNTLHIIEGNKIINLNEEEINKIKGKRKTALSKFLAAERIGILVSVKPGQEALKQALKIKNKLEKKGKEAKIFLADNINIEELENYSIESWLNTSCPALTFDSRVLDMRELEEAGYIN